MKTASYWRKEKGGQVVCELCPHGCRIAEGRAGRCRVRGVRGGELVALGYGILTSANMDPIEKKPLYHFFPGREIFSIGGWGCNFACDFCQNWSISQRCEEAGRVREPRDIVTVAKRSASVGIAYTYNEPLVGYEYVRDCATVAREAGLANVLVTNGYLNRDPAVELLPQVDALNIDIKSMDETFYAERCKGRLQPVLDFAKCAAEAGCHVEVTNLLIPGLNDAEHDVVRLAAWVAEHLGAAVPLHLSAYRPMYQCRIPATPESTVIRAWEAARAVLDYVYMGNVYGAGDGHDTKCPQCGHVLIRRMGYATSLPGVSGSACAACGREADVVLPRE
jgi:pyruvate formate lyase activating enzyme